MRLFDRFHLVSVRPQCSLCLCGEALPKNTWHRFCYAAGCVLVALPGVAILVHYAEGVG